MTASYGTSYRLSSQLGILSTLNGLKARLRSWYFGARRSEHIKDVKYTWALSEW
ncbi:hypothetical protein PUNSTDRAFT_55303 [Punctularia strigosozonata HHB-11173 SS5]|uniref:Uncharacterized protein n=1 Tax=Punctularia strigosozonata (strain HHB-11173) TaxID=741275 RepID=R7S558_PUNST|nr:uncharacterized protein PUNSTDRAFT_55303 [Punctularia strigosozonata HHB-11173 SS5]EIN05002.1 hypothetical protein PUNSTDRAFT_55303 [Punctularia strigosozonata HHB-11173 SS5]